MQDTEHLKYEGDVVNPDGYILPINMDKMGHVSKKFWKGLSEPRTGQFVLFKGLDSRMSRAIFKRKTNGLYIVENFNGTYYAERKD